MSKLGQGTGNSSNGNWQEQAKQAWEDAKKAIKKDGINSLVAYPADKSIKESTLTEAELDAMVDKAREICKDLADKEALIVGGKTGGGIEVKKPQISVYKDTLTIDFGRAKATKDSDPVALKAVINKECEITGVYASTAMKEGHSEKGTFTYPTDFKRYEAVENLPSAIKTLTEAIGFKNPEREQSNDGRFVNLPDGIAKDFIKKLNEVIKDANANAPKVQKDGKEVNEYYAIVEAGKLTEKGYFDNREGIEAGEDAYQIVVGDHHTNTTMAITIDKDSNFLSGKVTDFGEKDENGRYVNMFNSNLKYLSDKNNNIEYVKFVGEALQAVGYEPPKYEKGDKGQEAPEQEAPEQEVPEQDEPDIPFK